MANELSIPTIPEKPQAQIDTRPQAVNTLLAGLALNKPVASGLMVLEYLSKLNRHPLSHEDRLELMELLRPTIHKIVQGISPLFCNVPLPLSEKPKEAAQLAKNLLTELAFGYKHTLTEEKAKGFRLFGSKPGKPQPVMIQRALSALSHLQLLAYQTYERSPGGVWSELHHLFKMAVELNIADSEIADGDIKTTASLTYKQALLLFLADTRHLTTGNIERTREYLGRFAHLAVFQPVTRIENPAGIFLVHLESDDPPMPYAKSKGDMDTSSDVLLVTVELARLLNNQIGRLQGNEPPKNLGLPATANDQHYQDLLSYLLKHWALSPKRIFARSEKKTAINICIGLPALHYFLSGKTVYKSPVPAEKASEITEISLDMTASTVLKNTAEEHHSTQWQILNESAGGVALSKPAGVNAGIRIGELLGMRAEGTELWTIGVARWATCDGETHLDIGAQMIAPAAKPVAIRPEGKGDFEVAILLPAISALKQPLTLLTACGGYTPAGVLEIDMEGKLAKLMITRLVERTSCFERFQFSPV